MADLFTPRDFAGNLLLRGNCRRNSFWHFVLKSGLGLKPWLPTRSRRLQSNIHNSWNLKITIIFDHTSHVYFIFKCLPIILKHHNEVFNICFIMRIFKIKLISILKVRVDRLNVHILKFLSTQKRFHLNQRYLFSMMYHDKCFHLDNTSIFRATLLTSFSFRWLFVHLEDHVGH